MALLQAMNDARRKRTNSLGTLKSERFTGSGSGIASTAMSRALIDRRRKAKVLAALDRMDNGSTVYSEATQQRLRQEAHNKGWRKTKETPGLPR